MVGRPKRTFTEQEKTRIEQMALNNCNTETIANALNIPVNTLKRHFGRLLKTKRAEHRVNLRKYQMDLAKQNSQMATFLGKNVLDQTDKQIIKHESGIPVPNEAEKQALGPLLQAYKARLVNIKSVG